MLEDNLHEKSGFENPGEANYNAQSGRAGGGTPGYPSGGANACLGHRQPATARPSLARRQVSEIRSQICVQLFPGYFNPKVKSGVELFLGPDMWAAYPHKCTPSKVHSTSCEPFCVGE